MQANDIGYDDASVASEFGRPAEMTDEELFRLYVGPNADKFLKIYKKQLEKKAAISFNWIAFLVPLAWFFYRKLYVFGILILAIPVAAAVLFPNVFPDGAPIGMYVFVAMFANQWYVQIAMGRIDKMRARNLSREERNERIRKAGGTSPAGGVFGMLITASIIWLAFFADVPTVPQ